MLDIVRFDVMLVQQTLIDTSSIR